MRLGILTDTGVAEFKVKSSAAKAVIERTRHTPFFLRKDSDMAYLRTYVSRTLALHGHSPNWDTVKVFD